MTEPTVTGTQRAARQRVSPAFALVCAICAALLLFAAGAAEVLHAAGYVIGPCKCDGHGVPWTVWFTALTLLLPYAGNTEMAGRLLDKIPTFGARA